MTDKERYLEFWGYDIGTEEAEQAWADKCAMMDKSESAHYIITDTQPYRSMVTGEMIDGKRAHKDHLKRHGLIEIGNETKYLTPKEVKKDDKLKRQIAAQVYQKLRY